jgi:hypothetical protein
MAVILPHSRTTVRNYSGQLEEPHEYPDPALNSPSKFFPHRRPRANPVKGFSDDLMSTK